MLRLARTGFPYMYPYEQPACDDYDPDLHVQGADGKPR